MNAFVGWTAAKHSMEWVAVVDHEPTCPCDDTAHTCTNLGACRYCVCVGHQGADRG